MYRFISLTVVLVASPFASPANAQAVNDVAIQRAIQRGVAYLKGMQQKDGSWPPGQYHPGITALAGLALLEAGVPAKDAAVQKAVRAVRRDFLKIGGGRSGGHAYAAATVILFLDRLGEPDDEPLIDALVYWLLTSQTANGCWGYERPPFPARDGELLKKYLELTNAAPLDEAEAKEDKKKTEALAKEVQERMKELARQRRKPFTLRGPGVLNTPERPDHSCTQFAVLALWAGRRRGMAVDNAVKEAERHFLANQRADGTWHYLPNDPGLYPDLTPANTCNGLLVLAVAQAVSGTALGQTEIPSGERRAVAAAKKPLESAPGQSKKTAAEQDKTQRRRLREMQAGLAALARFIAAEIASRRGRPPTAVPGGQFFRGRNLYAFLWSLDKMAVAYDLETLGGIDWYRWGAEIALVNQTGNGSWEGGLYGSYGPVDTCFALLFLRRSNITKDLTGKLKGFVSDPGKALLRAAPKPDAAPEGKKKPEKGQKKAPEPIPANRSD